MQIVVALGGDLHDSALVRSALAGAGLVIAADSGAVRLAAIGIQPEVVIGDFDSIDHAELWRLRSGGVEIVDHPAPQQRTDADVAIEYALQRGATSLIVLGALGGPRIDHALGNLSLLTHPSLREIPTWAVDGWSAMTILRGDGVRETHFHGHADDYVSVIPISERVEGVSDRRPQVAAVGRDARARPRAGRLQRDHHRPRHGPATRGDRRRHSPLPHRAIAVAGCPRHRCAGALVSPPALRGEMPKAEGGRVSGSTLWW